MDSISSLPDEIVSHILSFLSTKEAALTSVLSKRWRNLFAFTPNLRFEENDFVYRNSDLGIPRIFISFLDRVLVVSGNSPLKKFTLKYRQHAGAAHINRWICNVLGRGVLDHLHLDVPAERFMSPPLKVFTCKTLVELKLGRGFVMSTVPKNSSLPALKTLFLDRLLFYDNQFETLLSACSALEELVMRDVESVDGIHRKLCGTVSCPTLQRLTLMNCTWRNCNYRFTRPDSRSISFDTPRLSYLEYHDTVAEAYPLINLDSLVEAKLDLILSVDSNPENLIKGLRNVHILTLSTRKTMETIYSIREAVPVFKNLVHLSLTTESNECCQTLPLLLKNSPNIETLVIKGPLRYNNYGNELESFCECLSGYSCLFSCCLKVLEVTSYVKTILELEQLKHFLEKLPCLELAKVRCWVEDKNENLRLATTDLQNLPRSSKCKIQYEFHSS